MKQCFLLLGVIFILCSTSYAEKNQLGQKIQTIVLFRHGEKPFWEFGQLNCQGYNRSLALPRVLESKFGKPDFIMAPNPYANGYYYYVRALLTIQPAAINWAMPVKAEFPFFYFSDIAKTLLEPKYHQSTILVPWEHLNIPFVAREVLKMLNQDEDVIPHWPGSDFDSLYVIKIDWNYIPVKVSFYHDYQNLNNQSEVCPAETKKSVVIDSPQVLVFIPSAETLTKKMDQLSCKGLNRSNELAKVLAKYYPRFDLFVLPPASINGMTSPHFLQTLTTIEPTIVSRESLYIPISKSNMNELALYLKSSAFSHQTIAITWPKETLITLIRTFYTTNGGNAADIPEGMSDNDTIYQLSIDKTKQKMTLSHFNENLNNVNEVCPGH